jgi:excinuclease ABC subunit B
MQSVRPIDKRSPSATAGSYASERPFGRAVNLPSTRPRNPTDADMGPHNWGGGEARLKGGKMRGRTRW